MALVFTCVAKRVAHAVDLFNVGQEIFGNIFSPQRIPWQQNRFSIITILCFNMCVAYSLEFLLVFYK